MTAGREADEAAGKAAAPDEPASPASLRDSTTRRTDQRDEPRPPGLAPGPTGGAGGASGAGVAETLRASPRAGGEQGVLGTGSMLEGTYRVEALLGKGAMGAVYLVEHVALGKKFAAKV